MHILFYVKKMKCPVLHLHFNKKKLQWIGKEENRKRNKATSISKLYVFQNVLKKEFSNLIIIKAWINSSKNAEEKSKNKGNLVRGPAMKVDKIAVIVIGTDFLINFKLYPLIHINMLKCLVSGKISRGSNYETTYWNGINCICIFWTGRMPFTLPKA